MKKVVYRTAFALLVLGIGVLAYFYYTLFYNFDIIEYRRTPLEILNENKRISKNETIKVRIQFCKKYEYPATVIVQFADGVILNTPVIESNTKVGCYDIVFQQTIPKILPPGKYKLIFNSQFRINNFRTVTERIDTEEFTITD